MTVVNDETRGAFAARTVGLAGLDAPEAGALAPTASDASDAASRRALAHGRRLLRDGPVGDACSALLRAAAGLRESDPVTARRGLLAAASAAWSAGDHDTYRRVFAVGPCRLCGAADAATPCARECPEAAWRDHRIGMSAVAQGDLQRAATVLEPRLLRVTPRAETEELCDAGSVALLLGRLPLARRLLSLALASARSSGAETEVPGIIAHLACAELREGRHPQARAHAEEGLVLARRLGQCNVAADLSAVRALVVSIAGDLPTVRDQVAQVLAVAQPHGLAQAAFLAEWAQARAELGAGKAEQAAARLAPLVQPGARQGHFGLWFLAVPCFVEACVLSDRALDAPEMVDLFAVWADLGADPQAPAQLARCRALLAPADRSEELYRAALAHHEKASGPYEHARTHLAYGMWLRRQRRPTEARTQLRAALMGFEHCGAALWAKRAGAELRAAGETNGTADAGLLSSLTPQQARIAQDVARGATNKEIAAELSISIRTVEYHLRNVFAQLGVRSRTGLAHLLANVADDHDRGGDLPEPG
ncbi:DNA-binding CsgD family transcriptional regulator/Tfp pilus assembly protein PilF [Streptomyces sp. SAI-124]|uniref:LuxR family transcriptional regulator n=1 Tax=unclassified Streptomyces TaxID=2593676 RepID=UPI00247633D7|nr:LuxR family transcriptional regulator [Streptomyces sp. SAI-117]MDH6565467.1 DNA-binding CsgD family transcriptional regulator/Tfp pilus assembly protein PilF [Streptomyces sp. SAI-117]